MHFDGRELRRCPRRPYLDAPEWFNEVFRAYQWLQKGYFPSPGTWADQPAKLIDLVEVIDRANASADAHERKEADEKARRQKRAAQGARPTRPRPRPFKGRR